MAKFLDENGVKKLWSRIQEYVYECCCSKGGGGDVGYECKDGYETFWKGNVETYISGTDDYASQELRDPIITAEKIRVMFQGTAYDFERRVVEGSSHTFYEYGEFTADAYNPIPILKNQPIAIISAIPNGSKTSNSGMLKAKPITSTDIYTRNPGNYNIEIQTPGTVVETTECFQKAVKSVGDSGYECTTSFEEAFSESGATTKETETALVARYTLDYADYIEVDEIKVVFNGTEYTCPKKIIRADVMYGASDPSFTDYPFTLISNSGNNVLLTKDPMDFDITVFAPVTTTTVTPCFETAVKTVMGSGNGVKVVNVTGNPSSGLVLDTSCDEMEAIVRSGGYLVGQYNGAFYTLDEVPSEWKKESSTKASAPTLKIVVPTLTFSRVDIIQGYVVKRECSISSKDCGVTYSELTYPIKEA